MGELISIKSESHLFIMFGALLFNLIVQYNIWNSLRYDKSDVGSDEEKLLLNSLLAQMAIVPLLIISALICLVLADNNKFGMLTTPRTTIITIFLYISIGIALIFSGITAYIAYKLQCSNLPSIVWYNLLMSVLIYLIPVISILFLQSYNRTVFNLKARIADETQRGRSEKAIYEAQKQKEILERLAGGPKAPKAAKNLVSTEYAKQYEQMRKERLASKFPY